MNNISWVIQTHVGPPEDIKKYFKACRRAGNPVTKIAIPPFSKHFPDDIDKTIPHVFLGGVNFVNLASENKVWKPFIFHNDNFKYSVYNEKYKKRMLNYESIQTTFGEFIHLPGPPDELVFVRPDRDLKEFPGTVIERINFRKWAIQIAGRGFTLDESCPILVSKPVGVSHEWRTFVADGKVITGSEYSNTTNALGSPNPLLVNKPGIPDDVRAFVEDACKIWTPALIFCMDVCRSNDLYIVECGSFHSAGLYEASADAIVEAVNCCVKNL